MTSKRKRKPTAAKMGPTRNRDRNRVPNFERINATITSEDLDYPRATRATRQSRSPRQQRTPRSPRSPRSPRPPRSPRSPRAPRTRASKAERKPEQAMASAGASPAEPSTSSGIKRVASTASHQSRRPAAAPRHRSALANMEAMIQRDAAAPFDYAAAVPSSSREDTSVPLTRASQASDDTNASASWATPLYVNLSAPMVRIPSAHEFYDDMSPSAANIVPEPNFDCIPESTGNQESLSAAAFVESALEAHSSQYVSVGSWLSSVNVDLEAQLRRDPVPDPFNFGVTWPSASLAELEAQLRGEQSLPSFDPEVAWPSTSIVDPVQDQRATAGPSHANDPNAVIDNK